MECYEADSLLIDFLDGQLQASDKEAVQQHLHSCEACRQALEEYRKLFSAIAENRFEKPSSVLREKFDIMLQSELNIDSTTQILRDEEGKKTVTMKKQSLLWKIAASIILIAGSIWLGTKLTPDLVHNDSTEIADLRKEVNEVKEQLMLNLLNEESASERIKAVGYAEEMNNPDDKIIAALIATLNEDKNVNVRLAALYSVTKFSDNPAVMDSLIASLRKQTEPIVQIALINFLTEKKEAKAKESIREILQDKKTLKPVKDIAQKGLNLL